MFGSNGKAVRSHSSRIQKRASATDAILTAGKPTTAKHLIYVSAKAILKLAKDDLKVAKADSFSSIKK
jgi:hypothetical protein